MTCRVAISGVLLPTDNFRGSFNTRSNIGVKFFTTQTRGSDRPVSGGEMRPVYRAAHSAR